MTYFLKYLFCTLVLLGTSVLNHSSAKEYLSGSTSKAFVKISTESESQEALLSSQSVYCTDENLPFSLVSSPSFSINFHLHPTPFVKGYTSQTCWLRYTFIKEIEDANWWLEIDPPFLDHVDVYLQDSDGSLIRKWSSGDSVAHHLRPALHNRLLFPVKLPDERFLTIYLRVKTTSTMRVDVALLSQNTLMVTTERSVAIYMFFAGFMTLNILLTATLWFFLRQKLFALYCFYLISILLLSLSAGGFLSSTVFSNQPIIADRSVGVLFCSTYLIAIVFFDNILSLSKKTCWGRWLYFLIICLYCIGILGSAAGLNNITSPVVQVVGMFVTMVITISLPILIWKGRKDLWIVMASFIFQLVGSLLIAASILGFLALPIKIDYLNIATTFPYVLLLSFALVVRLRNSELERRKLEAEAKRTEFEKASIEQERQFIRMLSHELRNPLAIIDTSAQRMALSRSNTEDAVINRCKNIRKAVSTMRVLMDEYLAGDRLEHSTTPLMLTKSNPYDLLKEVLNELDSERLRCDFIEKSFSFDCDRGLIKIALSNLISNALRYAPEESVVTLSASLENDGVTFCVHDKGSSLDKEEIDLIFQKFYRGKKAQTQTGAGLGLYIVDWIARIHGGNVTVCNKPNEGTSFCIFLPVQSG